MLDKILTEQMDHVSQSEHGDAEHSPHPGPDVEPAARRSTEGTPAAADPSIVDPYTAITAVYASDSAGSGDLAEAAASTAADDASTAAAKPAADTMNARSSKTMPDELHAQASAAALPTEQMDAADGQAHEAPVQDETSSATASGHQPQEPAAAPSSSTDDARRSSKTEQEGAIVAAAEDAAAAEITDAVQATGASADEDAAGVPSAADGEAAEVPSAADDEVAAVPPSADEDAAAAPSAADGEAADAAGPASIQEAAEPACGEQSQAHVTVLGQDLHKRNNLLQLSGSVMLTSAGNVAIVWDTDSGQRKLLPCRDGGGVGALAVHPSGKLFAVGGKARTGSPTITIYSYPELEVQKVLRGGTEYAYAALAFNPDGAQLASVGGPSDYLLAVWDWSAGSVLLRCKAFSQEVYSVAFAAGTAGRLVTSGLGHIRFWRMASTFTGLKLQGQTGKFGAVELSDVGAFAALPDGKVVAGTEEGDLLVWEGGLIKVVIKLPGGGKCHPGPADMVRLEQGGNRVISAGAGGWLRIWDTSSLADTEPAEGGLTAEVEPLAQVCLGPGIHVRSLTDCEGGWVIQDAAGGFHKVAVPKDLLDVGGYSVTRCHSCHAGSITGLVPLRGGAELASAGSDGVLRAYDGRSGQEVCSRVFKEGITAVKQLQGAGDGGLMLLGFSNGSVRAVRRCEQGWKLQAAVRPHQAAVTCVAVSPDSACVASCAADGSVFFLALDLAAGPEAFLQPVAGTRLAAGSGSISAATWAHDGREVLVAAASRGLLAIQAPAAGSVDTTVSYELQLPVRELTLAAALSRGLSRRAMAASRVSRAASRRALVAESSKQQAAQDNAASPAAAAAAVPEATEGEPSVAQGAEGGAVSDMPPAEASEGSLSTSGSPADLAQDKSCGELLAAAEPGRQPSVTVTSISRQAGSADGYLLATCSVASGTSSLWRLQLPADDDPSLLPLLAPDVAAAVAPQSSATLPPSVKQGVSYLAAAAHGSLLLLGYEDGRVAAVEVPAEPQLDEEQQEQAAPSVVWLRCPFDIASGSVTGVVALPASGTMASAAQDGSLCLHQLQQGELQLGPADGAAADVAADSGAEAPDLPEGVMTLEQGKQRAQQDNLMSAADRRRQELLRQVQAIRTEFDQLRSQVAKWPEAAQPAAEAWEVDPQLRQLADEKAAAVEEQVYAELSWDLERAALQLDKLQSFFLAGVEAEHAALHAFSGPACLASFRLVALPAGLQQRLAALAAQVREEAARAAAGAELSSEPSKAPVPGQPGAAAPELSLNPTSMAGESSLGMESRKVQRKLREAQWASFRASRPAEEVDHPDDVAAIAESERTVGDYMLKTDAEYVMDEAHRMTAAKKRLELLQLAAGVHALKSAFNGRFASLRSLKLSIIDEVNKLYARLREVNSQLGIHEPVPDLEMADDELPERRNQVAQEVIRQRLAARAPPPQQQQQQQQPQQQQAAAAQQPAGKGHPAHKPGHASPTAHVSPAGSGSSTPRQVPGAPLHATEPQPSELEQAERRRQEGRLLAEREQLLAQVSSFTASFDATLLELASEKLRMEAECLAVDTRLLAGRQELAILQECQVREEQLLAKRFAKLADLREIRDKAAGTQRQLDARSAEGEAIAGRRAAVVAEFDTLVPPEDPFREPLNRVFLRKIKRVVKRAGGGDSDGDSGSDDDMDDLDDEGDDDSEDEGPEVCPPGCDQVTYERVCDLRERRQEQEDLGSDCAKAAEVLRKEREQHSRKAKLVEQSMAAIDQDLADFQRDKQARLNKVPAVLTIKAHAVQLPSGATALPDNLSNGIVISRGALERLQRRLGELASERAALKDSHRSLQRQAAQLAADKASKEGRLAELQARCKEVQLLKFGQLIDLSVLDQIGPRGGGNAELKAQVVQQEKQQEAEVAQWEAAISGAKDQLLDATRTNTSRLQAATQLMQRHKTLDAQLTATQTRAGAGGDPVAERQREVDERDNLVAVINSQAQSIQALQAQLAALSRKDVSVHG